MLGRSSKPVSVLLDIGKRSLERFVELESFDRAMALAGQTFAALMPLMIVLGAVTPAGGKDLADGLVDRFELSGATASTVQASVSQPTEIPGTVSAFSAFVLVVSALSFTRALQRLYVRAWRLPKLGMYGNAWGLLWLTCFAGFWCLQPVIVGLFDGTIAVLIAVALSAVLWLFTPWILVGKRIPWPRLLPQALLTTLGLTLFTAASAIYMPRTVSSASEQFGFIGVAFALLSWLFVGALILVVGAAFGAVLVEPRAQVGRDHPLGVKELRAEDP
jgi:membrane protein